MNEFLDKIEPGKTRVAVIDPDLIKVDQIITRGKSLRDSMANLTQAELIAEYKKPLEDDEMGTYFAKQELKRAIEGILIDKFKFSGLEVRKLLEDQK